MQKHLENIARVPLAWRDRFMQFYDDHARGIIGFALGTILWISRFYKRRVWNRFARNKEGRATWKRGIATVIGSFVTIYWVIPCLFILTVQTILYGFTARHESIHLAGTQQIEQGIHSSWGCQEYPCDDLTTRHFHSEDSLFNDLHSWLTRGHGYYPDAVAKAIPSGVSKCDTVSYGIRSRLFMRVFGYPTLLYAKCTPISGPAAAAMPPATPEN